MEKDTTGLDRSRYILTLCEVVVVGGMLYLQQRSCVAEWVICIKYMIDSVVYVKRILPISVNKVLY